MVLWDISPQSSQYAGFLNKVAMACLNNSSLNLLVYHVASSMSLNLVAKEYVDNIFYYLSPEIATHTPLPYAT